MLNTNVVHVLIFSDLKIKKTDGTVVSKVQVYREYNTIAFSNSS